MLHDIETPEDIRLLVDTFYTRVQMNPVLGPIFHQVIQNRWPEHLEKMYSFWETLLLGAHSYTGSPFPPHAVLPLTEQHFENWLYLFRSTLADLFAGPKTQEASWRAGKMAEVFSAKMEMIRNQQFKPLD